MKAWRGGPRVIVRRHAAMTLDEIALEMGTTKKNVAVTLRVAMDKIRRRPESLDALRELVRFRGYIRERGGAL